MDIHQRIQLLRAQHFGPRGRARFARSLGISPSTYNYYERDRVPPPDLLMKISQITGTDLQWLISGESSDIEIGPMPVPLLNRVKQLLNQRPELTPALAAFIDLLERPNPADKPHPPKLGQIEGAAAEVIPILGRTAAGVPHFWSEGELDEQPTTVRPDQWTSARRCELSDVTSPQSLPQATVLIQTPTPIAWAGISVSEFLHTPTLGEVRANTFGLRIDGDSMAPALLHGDILLICPTEPAQSGQPAVVQLRNQIGLTCKLYRRQSGEVHLIPINETFRPTSHLLDDVLWALRVLARVRI